MLSAPFALNLSQHQGLFQWVSCSHQMTKILELQLQHQAHRFDPWVGKINPLEKEMATHSSNVAWENPWTEEPGGFMGSQESYVS